MTRTTAEWEDLLDGTTPGPWAWETGEKVVYRHELLGAGDLPILKCGALRWPDEGDEALIAAVPEAVAELVRIRRELEQLADQLKSRADNLQAARQYVAATGSRETAEKITRILKGNA